MRPVAGAECADEAFHGSLAGLAVVADRMAVDVACHPGAGVPVTSAICSSGTPATLVRRYDLGLEETK
ncbi:MAG: hypothetical protein ACRD6B_10465 [Bryobacteraceae bacterium]